MFLCIYTNILITPRIGNCSSQMVFLAGTIYSEKSKLYYYYNSSISFANLLIYLTAESFSFQPVNYSFNVLFLTYSRIKLIFNIYIVSLSFPYITSQKEIKIYIYIDDWGIEVLFVFYITFFFFFLKDRWKCRTDYVWSTKENSIKVTHQFFYKRSLTQLHTRFIWAFKKIFLLPCYCGALVLELC